MRTVAGFRYSVETVIDANSMLRLLCCGLPALLKVSRDYPISDRQEMCYDALIT